MTRRTEIHKDIRERRRLALQALVDQIGHGGIVAVARAADIPPSYLSRLLYPPEKHGAKNMGEGVALRIEEAFPGWMEGAAVIERIPPSVAVSHGHQQRESRQLSLLQPSMSAPAGDELMVAYAQASEAKKELVRAVLLKDKGYSAQWLEDEPLVSSALYAAEKKVEEYLCREREMPAAASA